MYSTTKKTSQTLLEKKVGKITIYGHGNFKCISCSPGIPINAKNKHLAIQYAIKNKVKIINEIDLFFETKPEAKIIGITGTNGKSTTVALLFRILKFNHVKCVI